MRVKKSLKLLILFLFILSPKTQSEQIKTSIPAQIVFGIVDLKFDGKRIKICEFGDGITSSFKGYDIFYGEGATWSKFWNYLDKLNTPILYGNLLEQKKIDFRKNEINSKTFAFDCFFKLNGKFFNNSKNLITNPTFLKSVEGIKVNDPTNISNFKAILLIPGAQKNFLVKSQMDPLIERFKKSFPATLIINEGISLNMNHKLLSSLVFTENKLNKYKPNFLIIDRSESKTEKICQKIAKKINCDRYVIKPINSTRCNGVSIVEKENLEKVLTAIFNKSKSGIENIVDDSFDFWTSKINHRFFLVEEYCPSKIIIKNGKKYDPTMRAIFVSKFNKSECQTTFLGGYWKTPKLSLEEKGAINDKFRSFSQDQLNSHYLKVAPQDFAIVKNQLSKILPNVILKMHSKKIPPEIMKLVITNDKEKTYKGLIQYLNIFGLEI